MKMQMGLGGVAGIPHLTNRVADGHLFPDIYLDPTQRIGLSM
jgi:hypothetical protein